MRSLEEQKETKEERKEGEKKRQREQKSPKDVFSPCEQRVVTGVGVGCNY